MKIENAPGEDQQAPSLEEALSDSFDEMSASESDETVFEDNSIEEHQDAEVEVSAEGGEETPETTEEEVEQEEVVDYNEAAPERWPEEIRSKYDALPADMKKVFMEELYKPMQRSFTEKTTDLAQTRKQLEPMMKTLENHQNEFQKAGINPVEAFNRQMAWSAHFAKVGPKQGAIDLAAAYGQDTGQQDNSNVYLTPVEKAQQERIDRLEQGMQTREQQDEARQQQASNEAVNQQQQEVRGSITEFANEVRDGKPLHPHVEKVSAQMAGLIRGGLVHRTNEYGQPVPYIQQLGQAYQLACEMDPSIRGARDTKTRQEQVKSVTAASREVVSKTPGSDVEVQSKNLSDDISDLYDRLDRSAA